MQDGNTKPRHKRVGYLTGLRQELQLAESEHMHPAIVAELKERIEAHLEYKRQYHKRTYVPRVKQDKVPESGNG